MADNGRILIVEDELSIQTLMAFIFEDEGLSVRAVEDGPTACALAEVESFDVMLVDYLMPGMNGLEVAMTVRRHQPSIVIALVSGSAHLVHPDEITRAGIDHVVPKPFDVAVLSDWVKSHLPRS